jgi:hypothetical protein
MLIYIMKIRYGSQYSAAGDPPTPLWHSALAHMNFLELSSKLTRHLPGQIQLP